MQHTSYIEISKSAFQHNLSFIRAMLGKNVRLSSVVKGNAYGHEVNIVVPILQESGVDHFSVFSADEAYKVHKLLEKNSSVMIMGFIDNDQIEWAIENNIEFYVFDLDRLKKTISSANKLNKKARIHLEIETGMNRTGLETKEIKIATELIMNALDHVEVLGICTHFAGAEEIGNKVRIDEQIVHYDQTVKEIKKLGIEAKYQHIACSAGAMRYPETQRDMVRIGILQYGFFPNQEVMIDYLAKKEESEYPLRRAISWKSKVMDVKNVKAGEYVGYGRSYLANVDTKIATVPVGYAHGFTRSLSNQGRVLIRGQRLPVIGTVNMNMMSVDVSSLEQVEKGDEVTIIGRQGDMEISVASFSETSDQVNYELLTRLPTETPRIVIA